MHQVDDDNFAVSEVIKKHAILSFHEPDSVVIKRCRSALYMYSEYFVDSSYLSETKLTTTCNFTEICSKHTQQNALKGWPQHHPYVALGYSQVCQVKLYSHIAKFVLNVRMWG